MSQHLSLSVAAHLARTQLVPDPLGTCDAQHMSERLDLVAAALARVAPLYVQDPKTGAARELTPADLDGATVLRGATVLALKDGRTLSSVSMKRADLRSAIAILKALGIPELRTAPPQDMPAPLAERPQPLAPLAELESLLRLPLIAPYVEKANALAVSIARHARRGQVANLAMQLVSAVHETSGKGEAGDGRVAVALARLRTALEEEEKTQ